MVLSLTLIHNKPTIEENEAQIEELKKHVETRLRDIPELDEEGNPVLDELGNPIIHQIPYYAFKDLAEEHEVLVMHIVPYQEWNKREPYEAEKPKNINDLFTRAVYYGKGDEDKVGEHPRFFNWSLKRGTDIGGEYAIYIEDVTKFDFSKLQRKLSKLQDENDTTEYAEDDYGRLASVKLLREVGQVREDTPLPQAIADLKQRVERKGLRNG